MNNKSDVNFKNIYEFIFNFVASKFDDFGHRCPTELKDGNWWKNHKYGTSWGPIIQWAYIKKGFDLGYAIREDHTYHNLHDVARDFDNFRLNGLSYGEKKSNGRKNKFPNFKKIDVCWGESDYSFNIEDLVLVLEYEEMDKVKAFGQDVDKLLSVNSIFRIIIVRLIFPDNSDGMRLDKLKQILNEKCQNKSFGFIFIYPINTSRIVFEGFEWNLNMLKTVEPKSFEIQANEKYVIKREI